VVLNDLVSSLVGQLRKMVAPDVTLATELDPAAGAASIDPGRIGQVISNLVVNAGEAMPRGGRVTIVTRAAVMWPEGVPGWPGAGPGRYVELQVRDQGAGIASDILPRIFEPFFTTKAPTRGTGLGLATVHGIVSQTGGAVTVSSAPGDTIFSVLLPAVTAPAARAAAPSPAPSASGSETIVLAEDEAVVRELTASILRRAGYTVLVGANGDEALHVYEDHPGRVALLVTDVVMPRMSGRVLAERIRERQPGIPVLFMSGYTDDALVRHGVQTGELAFLAKPFTPRALTTAVRRLIDGEVEAGGRA
jgi:CheY-like chemotaxis protein